MRHNGSFDLGSAGFISRLAVRPSSGIPPDVKVGEFILLNRRLMLCVDWDDAPVLIPLTQEIDVFRFDTGSPALEWVINHPLNSARVFVQLFDENGKVIGADDIDCSVKNKVIVKWNAPQAGSALLMLGETVGTSKVDYAFVEDFTDMSVWTVQHNLGYRPQITCIVGNYIEQPVSIDQTDVNKAVITWSSAKSGTVRCV